MHNLSKNINKKSNLNEEIIKYYNKYGRNRNLEKYLRLKSSSEGSISTPESITKNIISDLTDEYETSPKKKLNEKHKKKSYSFECESNIAITIPYIETASMPNLSSSSNIREFIAEASQTEFESLKSEGNADELTQETNNDTPPTIDKHIIEKTPESILKSTSKRLEWDSLADVGYEKNIGTNKKPSTISTLERSVLKDFFADKGIEISFPNNKPKCDNDRLPKINEEINVKKKYASQGAIPKTKEKWRETLENVQKKYRSLPTLTEQDATGKSFIQFKDIYANRHSTPKPIGLEKFCQTTLVKKDTQEIQCSFSNSESVRSAFEVGSMTSQSSFEYIPQVLESEASCSNKENISPTSTQNNTIEQKLRKSVSKLFELQKNQSVNQKFQSEIDLGIQLLCTLIESQKLSDQQKKILAKKIVGKITKTTQSCENQSTNMTLTATATQSNSINSLVSTSSLIGKNNENKNELSKRQHDELVMSGVESLKSSKTDDEMYKSKSESVSRRSSVKKIDSIKHQTVDKKIDCYNKKTFCEMLDKSNQVNIGTLTNKMKNLDIPTKKHVLPKEYESTSATETATSKSETTDDQETMREWLDPLTRSEIKYEDIQKRKAIQNIDIGGSGDYKPVINENSLIKMVENEKKAHFDWIEMEIKRLEQLKEFLVKEGKHHTKCLGIVPDFVEQNISSYPIIYVNDEKFEIHKTNSSKPKSSKSGTAKSSENSKYSSHSSNSNKTGSSIKKTESGKSSSSEILNDIKEINIDIKIPIKKDKNFVIYDNAAGTVSNSKSRKSNKYKAKFIQNMQDKKQNENNRKHRSKLETPKNVEPTESVRSFARQKKLDFIEIYRQAHSRDYDHPAETDHYSEPRNHNRKRLFVKKSFTSASSSNLFISSDSISIPPGGESSSMTTTHQYDNRCGIGIQTTDSILETCPINDIQRPRRPTQRIYAFGKDQQTQVRPGTVSYVIKFDKEDKTDDNENSNDSKKFIINTDNFDCLTLEERFKKSRPQYYSNIIERQCILRNMQEFRQKREKKIRDIVENTSIRSIPRKLDQLPPPATKYTRVFSTREMKAMTKRKQVQLPEVLKKLEQQKKDRKQKGNLILKDVFNKRLQRQVHKGKINLDHSQTVI